MSNISELNDPTSKSIYTLAEAIHSRRNLLVWSTTDMGATCLLCVSSACPQGTYMPRRLLDRHLTKTPTHTNNVVSHHARVRAENAQAAATSAAATARLAARASHGLPLLDEHHQSCKQEPYEFEGWTARDNIVGHAEWEYWEGVVDQVARGFPVFCDTNWGYNLSSTDEDGNDEEEEIVYPEEDICTSGSISRCGHSDATCWTQWHTTTL